MRIPPAYVTQRPFRKWIGDRYAADLDLNKLGYPIINVRAGIHWVVDGQHRIYALKVNGFEKELLECEVYENLTDAEMAAIFIGRDDRCPISLFDKFHVCCTAGQVRENDIRRTIESNGLKVSQTGDRGSVRALAACGKVYDRSGAKVLGQTLRVLRDAFDSDAGAFDRYVIEGLGHAFGRYNGGINEREMAACLAATSQGIRGVLRRAEALREKLGAQKPQCVASVVVDLYNRGRGNRAKDRLPSWWKEAQS